MNDEQTRRRRLHLVMWPGEVGGVWKTVDEMTDAEVIDYGAKALAYASDRITSGATASLFVKDEDLIARLAAIAKQLRTS